MTLPNPLPLPLYKSTDRSQMRADVVRLIGGGRDVCYRKVLSNLMTALIKLPPHPLDRMQSSARFGEAVQQTAPLSMPTPRSRWSLASFSGNETRRDQTPQAAFAARCDVPGGGTCPAFDTQLAAVFKIR